MHVPPEINGWRNRAAVTASVMGIVASVAAIVGIYDVEPSWWVVLAISVGSRTMAADLWLKQHGDASEE